LLVFIAGLGLCGGLALACFARAVGAVFLGEPRSRGAAEAAEVARPMWLAMALLAGGLLLLGVAGPIGLAAVSEPVRALLPGEGPAVAAALEPLRGALWRVGAVGAGVAALAGLLAALRARLLRGRSVSVGPTWDCGYAAPTSRMQYTASSFSEPLAALFESVLRPARSERAVEGLFPGPASFSSRPRELAIDRLFRPLFGAVEALALRLRPLQNGSIHLYVLYVGLAAVGLLLWGLG
jgi:NADH:ubiquinone oxidoreductase subunit 5 (subunit L)/multisubunit Na+/H+ antiporter MnhA subunit